MNRTQKKILGWALIAIGVLMVLGAVVSNPTINSIRGNIIRGGIEDIFKSPLLYLGLFVGVAGAVVLAGHSKSSKSANDHRA